MGYHSVLKSQKLYFRSGATRSLEFRVTQLERLHTAIKTHETKVLEALFKDLHKAPEEAFITEVGVLYEEIEITKKNLRKWMAPEKVKTPLALWPGRAQIVKEPLGSVCIFAPWNYPFQLLMAPLIGAIASGNCAVLKPAHLTPHTQKVILDLVQETFDAHYVAAVGGELAECEELLKENFDFIFFTGSPRVGRIVMEAAAKNLTPICLELGGKSPCIVTADANLDIAAKRICWAKFLNAGQTCVAPDYVYIHKDIKNEFLNKCKEVVLQYFGVDPRLSSSFGRIVNSDHFDRLKHLLENEEVFHGGEALAEERYIAPTILNSITWQSELMKGEIFGPIMPILDYENLDQVKGEILDRDKPLALYIYSSSKTIQQELVDEVSSGGVCVNDCVIHLANPYLPFGGVGKSGMGAYHGKKSFDLLSHHKAVQKSSDCVDPPLRYPPYSEKKLKWIKRFLG